MAKDPMSSFEIPSEMRNLAEQSVEQARKAFDGYMTAAQQAVEALEGQATVAQAGTKNVGKKAMTFAEQNVATSFEFAQKLVRAKDVQEVLRLQGEFVQAQMQALSEQAKELSETASKVAMEAAKPSP
jgi:phasin